MFMARFTGIFRIFIVLSIIALLFGCSGKSGSINAKGESQDYKLAPNTKILDSDTTSNLSSVSDDGVTLSFSASTTQLDAIKTGDIIISGVSTAAPKGLLKKVVSINKSSDGTIQVTTSQATLTDAFQELHISGTIPSSKNVSPASAELHYIMRKWGISGSKSIPEIPCSIPLTNWSVSGSYNSSLSGNYTFTPDLDYDIDISGSHLNKFKLALVGDATLDMNDSLSITSAVSFSPETVLDALMVSIPIDLGPVLLTIEFTPSIGVEFSSEGKLDVSAGFTSTSTVTAGFEYSNNTFSPITSYNGTLNPYYTIGDQVSFSARPYLSAKLGFYIYSALGPYIDLQPYGEISYIATQPSHIEKSYGIKGDAGGEVKVYTETLANFSLQLFDINIPLDETGYTVSGKVTSGGVGLTGVKVTLAGANTLSAVTAATGSYSFPDVTGGSYTLTPALAGYSFGPSSIPVTVNNESVSVSDIIATFNSNPAVAQTPLTVKPGDTVTQSGTGFTPNSTATLHFSKPDGTELTPLSQAIGSDGMFSINYTIPTDQASGTYTWWGVDISGKVSNTVSYIVANAYVSNGNLTGINGYNVTATIDVNPNYGDAGTPASLTITFTSGASLVSYILDYYASESTNWQFYLNTDMPSSAWYHSSQNVWQVINGYLTGNYAVERYYVVTSSGVKIAVGDIWFNGSPVAVPDWQHDGIGDTVSSASSMQIFSTSNNNAFAPTPAIKIKK